MASLRPKRILVFASGQGTGFRALLERHRKGQLHCEVVGLVSNIPGCGATAIAREFSVPVVELPHTGVSRREHEKNLCAAVEQELNIDIADPSLWFVLSGYMRLLTPEFVAELTVPELHAARMVNIHPSLLPSFPGVNGYEQAIAYGVKVAGATVHLVTHELDSGPIVMQRSIEVREGETVESLKHRGQEMERQLYGDALNALAKGNWQVTAPQVTASQVTASQVSKEAPSVRPRVVFL